MSSLAVVVAPETSVKQTAAILDERGFTCLLVVDGDRKLAGAVSEADLLMNRFLRTRTSRSSSVRSGRSGRRSPM
jgi:CBS-domain-containing membrane protein